MSYYGGYGRYRERATTSWTVRFRVAGVPDEHETSVRHFGYWSPSPAQAAKSVARTFYLPASAITILDIRLASKRKLRITWYIAGTAFVLTWFGGRASFIGLLTLLLLPFAAIFLGIADGWVTRQRNARKAAYFAQARTIVPASGAEA